MKKDQNIKNKNIYTDKTNLSQSIQTECILKPVQQKDIYPEPGGRITLRLYLRLETYTQAKAYNPISLLFFLQKIMQRVMTRNIKGETLWHVSYIYKKAYKPGNSKETAMHHVITHIQEKVKKMKSHLSIPKH
jgi:hypothetical protein